IFWNCIFAFYADPDKHLMTASFGNYLAYAFVFENNKWKKTAFDPFGANMEDIQIGKIARPFLTVKKNNNQLLI
ncbi:MAG TPA: hypothetical protein VEX65_11320, partial [Flavisolibacter sp.]|nr:hypothetical protein [Flavisolibacter sp.]